MNESDSLFVRECLHDLFEIAKLVASDDVFDHGQKIYLLIEDISGHFQRLRHIAGMMGPFDSSDLRNANQIILGELRPSLENSEMWEAITDRLSRVEVGSFVLPNFVLDTYVALERARNCLVSAHKTKSESNLNVLNGVTTEIVAGLSVLELVHLGVREFLANKHTEMLSPRSLNLEEVKAFYSDKQTMGTF